MVAYMVYNNIIFVKTGTENNFKSGCWQNSYNIARNILL